MAHKSTPPLISTPHPSHPLLWPTRAIALLLLLQSVVVIAVTWYYFSRVNWTQIDASALAGESRLSSLVLRPLTEAFMVGGVFLPFAILLMFSAVGFLMLRRAAWLLAMICQSGILLACLLIYFGSDLRLGRSNMLYVMLLLCIMLVLYLNSTDVRLAFDSRRQQAPEEWLERLEFEDSGINYLPLLTDNEPELAE